MHIDDNQNPFSLVADFEGDESSVFDVEMEATLPILPLRNMVLFPGVVMPVAGGRKGSLRLAKAADKNKLNIGVVCQLSPETENPGFDDLYHIGTMAKIIRILELPDRSTTVILQGMSRFDLKGIVSDQPYLTGMVEKLEDTLPSKNNKEFEILVEACRERTMQYIQMSDQMPKESMFAVKNVSNNMFLVNFVCANFPFPIVRKMELLREGALDLRTVNLLKSNTRNFGLRFSVRPGKIWTCSNVSTFCNNKSKTYRMNLAVRPRIRTCTIYVRRLKKRNGRKMLPRLSIGKWTSLNA